MPKRTSKTVHFFFLIVLGAGVLSAASSPAYRGVDSFVCRELAELFSKSPGLLRYEDLDRLGDCVQYYKRIFSVLRRTGETSPQSSRSDPTESQPTQEDLSERKAEEADSRGSLSEPE